MNKYMREGSQPQAKLPDGTLLYPAYYPYAFPGERVRRSLSTWDGASGETVCVTADGQLYRRGLTWWDRGGEWRKFRLA